MRRLWLGLTLAGGALVAGYVLKDVFRKAADRKAEEPIKPEDIDCRCPRSVRRSCRCRWSRRRRCPRLPTSPGTSVRSTSGPSWEAFPKNVSFLGRGRYRITQRLAPEGGKAQYMGVNQEYPGLGDIALSEDTILFAW